MRFFQSLLAVAVCLVPVVFAQNRVEIAQPMTLVTLGQSVIPLYGPWKFTVGDSPLDPVTHAPLWAQPGFDDSKWETVDLTPKAGAFDPIAGLSGYVEGWTAKGHPNHWGYGWYRIRVQVAAQPGESLALAGPADVDDAYELFNDGNLVGSFGRFTGSHPVFYFTQPMMFDLPQAHARESSRSQVRVLAFRLWMAPETPLTNPDTGGLHTAPLLGNASAVSAGYQLRWLELVRTQISRGALGVLFIVLAIICFGLTRLDQSDPAYVWIGVVSLLTAATYLLIFISTSTQLLDATSSNVLLDAMLIPLGFGGWIMVWWIWFRLKTPFWVPRAVALLTLGFMITNLVGENLLYPLISLPIANIFHTGSLVLRLGLLLVLGVVVYWGIRRQGVEGWLVLPAVALFVFGQFYEELAVMRVRVSWYPFGIRIQVSQIADLLLTAVVSVLLLRRLLRSVREQRLLALDVKQAQEVQSVILPEARTVLPGMVVESEYRPAREVGGDFFQVVPNQREGNLLIVAGDVTGKGLKAGMLVALLVGAIRTAAETSTDPLQVLNVLNRRLLGRGDSQATCLALRIDHDGSATLANAGHMPPYLNGEAMEMEGALPLGMMERAEFSVMTFKLNTSDRLMLLSDGVAEATDENGKLFGFERVHALMRTALSTSEVASVAQKFGQVDDISVISVTRTEVLTPTLA